MQQCNVGRHIMRPLIIISFLIFSTSLFGQKAEDFGFRHLQTIYNGDTVDIVIKSKKGEENIKKILTLSDPDKVKEFNKLILELRDLVTETKALGFTEQNIFKIKSKIKDLDNLYK